MFSDLLELTLSLEFVNLNPTVLTRQWLEAQKHA